MLNFNAANATVAFPGPVGALSRAREKGEVDCDQKPFEIVVRRHGDQMQAYLLAGEITYDILAMAASASTIEGALTNLLLDIGDLATERIMSRERRRVSHYMRHELKKAFDEGGKYANRYFFDKSGDVKCGLELQG